MSTPNLKALRKEAREAKKNLSIKTHEAQQMVANRHGHKDWRSLVSSLERQSFRFSLPKHKDHDSVSDVLSALVFPSFEFAMNDVLFITGMSGTGKSLLLKEASLQALNQGLSVLYLGYYPSAGHYDPINYNDQLESHEGFWPVYFESSLDEGRIILNEMRILDILDNLGSNTLVIVDESPEVQKRLRLELIFEKDAVFFVSNQCLTDVVIAEQSFTIEELNTHASMLYLGSFSTLGKELDVLNSRLHLGARKSLMQVAKSNLSVLSKFNECGIWFNASKASLIPSSRALISALV